MKVEDIAAAVNRGVGDAGLAWELPEDQRRGQALQSMKGVNEANFILVNREYAGKAPEAVAKLHRVLIDMSQLTTTDPKKAGEMIAANWASPASASAQGDGAGRLAHRGGSRGSRIACSKERCPYSRAHLIAAGHQCHAG